MKCQCTESKTWPETQGGVIGGGKVLHWPQTECGTRLCRKHRLSAAFQTADQHIHDLAFPSECLRLGNYKKSKPLCCTPILPLEMGGKTNNTDVVEKQT